jgi:hypothetical protein
MTLAATITVTTAADTTGGGSLREAIASANPGDESLAKE